MKPGTVPYPSGSAMRWKFWRRRELERREFELKPPDVDILMTDPTTTPERRGVPELGCRSAPRAAQNREVRGQARLTAFLYQKKTPRPLEATGVSVPVMRHHGQGKGEWPCPTRTSGILISCLALSLQQLVVFASIPQPHSETLAAGSLRDSRQPVGNCYGGSALSGHMSNTSIALACSSAVT